MSNKLGDALSPYLLQHKDNPVNWYPWGETALKLAADRNLPIFLSIGYAACHWCHVMAEESFTDTKTAAYLNEHFISIKVDREERPDLDNVYMNALLRIQGQGGWPMSLFLFPDGKPFFGGTYYPKEERYGLISFIHLLRNIQHFWIHEQSELKAISQQLSTSTLPKRLTETPHPNLTKLSHQALLTVDTIHGGSEGTPKFPQIPLWLWLTCLAEQSKNSALQEAAATTALKLCRGGIFDHVGGGWMRYSLDEQWLVPHFEKMLYDNAMIIRWLCQFAATELSTLCKERITQTLEWLNETMRLSNHLYAASLDADSEHEEGKFYVWQRQEVDAILGENSNVFCRAYDITTMGNWEGKNIPHQNHSQFSDQDYQSALDLLKQTRNKRIPPGRDDKILTDWNALLITALVQASFAFDQPNWLELAQTCFDALEKNLYQNQQWLHGRRNDQLTEHGFLEDYANIIEAAIALYCHTHQESYLQQAQQWTRDLETHYFDSEQHLFMQGHIKQNTLFTPSTTLTDQATPSGNGMMALNYCKLWLLTQEIHYQQQAQNLINYCRSSPATSFLNMAEIWLNTHKILHFDFKRLTPKRKNALLKRIDTTTLVVNVPNAKCIQYCFKQQCTKITYRSLDE